MTPAIHRAKKSLGQNFLKSNLALKKIVEAGQIMKDDVILEIGPGKGALTEQLLVASGKKVIAIEKDRELFEFLKNKFATQISSGSLVLVHDDVLDFQASAYGLKPSAYKIVANIPYNITGAILKKFLTEQNQPESMILMVQHEVAKRIVAGDKKESILSISVKAYGEPKMIMKVPARYFSPAPKVDSAVIAIKNISRKNFETPSPSGHSPLAGGASGAVQEKNLNSLVLEERFWEIVKAGFAHKRKMLAGNLKGVVKDEILQSFGKKRAEDLTLEDWMRIAKA